MDEARVFNLRANNLRLNATGSILAALLLLGFLAIVAVVELYVGLTVLGRASPQTMAGGWILLGVGMGTGGVSLLLGLMFVHRPAERLELLGSRIRFIDRRGRGKTIDLARRTSQLSLRHARSQEGLFTVIRPYGIRAFLSQDAVEAIEAVAILNSRRIRRDPPAGAASPLLSLQIERGRASAANVE